MDIYFWDHHSAYHQENKRVFFVLLNLELEDLSERVADL